MWSSFQLNAERYKNGISFKNDSIVYTEQSFLAHFEAKTYQFNARQGGLWDAIVSFVDWLTSPFRPVWGKYEEDGMRKDAPYFLFNRYKWSWLFLTILLVLKHSIQCLS